ncbi:MAG: hypothetical protein ACOX52_13965 [Verrucomicrobiota bacterium]
MKDLFRGRRWVLQGVVQEPDAAETDQIIGEFPPTEIGKGQHLPHIQRRLGDLFVPAPADGGQFLKADRFSQRILVKKASISLVALPSRAQEMARILSSLPFSLRRQLSSR